MGKKKKNNKNDQRQVSQPPTDTSETTMPEQSESNGEKIWSELSQAYEQISTLNFATPSNPRPLASIGWMAPVQQGLKMNYDTNLARLCKTIGGDGFNYMAFPMGGLERATYKFPTDAVEPINLPRINLPDVQFDRYLWQTYVIGTVSPWIDTDHPNKAIAAASVKALNQELNHGGYLGVRTIIIPLLRANCPNLLKLLNHYLWVKSINFTIALVLPTTRKALLDHEDLGDDDIFNLWVSIRRKLKNFSSERLSVALKLTSKILDDEFLSLDKYERWNGEPLFTFIISTESFEFEPMPLTLNSKLLDMVESHRRLVFDLAISLEMQRFLVMSEAQIWEYQRRQIVEYLTPLLNHKKEPILPLQNNDRSLSDILLLPMETIWKDLSASEYDVLESDAAKYQNYCEAISYLIGNEIDLKNGLVIYILGAGRGGLVGPCLDIVKARFPQLHKIVNLIAVEKNASACNSLRYKNSTLWHNKLRVIEGDMRYVLTDPDLPKADLVISELLGSFGDNELAPECLKAASSVSTSNTQFVPYQFSSLLSPICVHRATDQLRDSFVSVFDNERAINVRYNKELGDFVYSRPKHWTDHLYVSSLNRYYEACTTKEVFQFKFPGAEGKKDLERHVRLTYPIKNAAEISGFLGHFVAVLASDIFISNSSRYRNAASACCKSWFPCYLPLREEIRVKADSQLVLDFWRKSVDDGAWYEWQVSYTEYSTNKDKITVLQNKDGESYFMPLFPKDAENSAINNVI